jgi:hypothetical protein
MNIYGIVLKDSHVDVSTSEKYTKKFATINGYRTITIRYNCGYIANKIFYKSGNKWIELKYGQNRYI